MARAVEIALRDGKHLIAEAGTGVGKSFAYLVPAILHATSDQQDDTSPAEPNSEPPAPADDDKTTRRIIVSTHTISLQEQLINKDLPLLNAVIPREFSSVLVKGRANYLSLRRLELAKSRALHLLNDVEYQQLGQIHDWTKTTSDGSLSSLAFKPSAALWDEVSSDNVNCLGRKCKTYNNCFYYMARRRVYGAQILVVNHALFFTDLSLRSSSGFGILPEYDCAILDECHTIESVASAHLGIKVTNGQVQYALNKLYNPATQRGLFAALKLDRLMELVSATHASLDQMAFDLDQWMGTDPSSAKRVRATQIVPNPLNPLLTTLISKLDHLADNAHEASYRQDLVAASERLKSLVHDIDTWLAQTDPALVYWLERTLTRRGDIRVEMHAAPIDVSSKLREMLFQKTRSVILASATISIGRTGGFEFFQSRIGAAGCATIKLGSPFDYPKQAEIILTPSMPDPASNRKRYEELLPEMIKRYLIRTDGHAFVLFTSHSLLRTVAAQLQRWFAEMNLTLFSQADGLPRTQLLDRFKQTPRSALFGTDSFWQGVDVPGDALRNVIITKLPFSVPDHPLLEARLDAIRSSGGNPFRDYQIPEAVIKLRQGFGRLIRTATDEGIVVILDPRIDSKPYGRIFLDSLPNCRIVRERLSQ